MLRRYVRPSYPTMIICMHGTVHFGVDFVVHTEVRVGKSILTCVQCKIITIIICGLLRGCGSEIGALWPITCLSTVWNYI